MRRPFHNAERKNIFCYMKNAAVILNLENALFNLNLVRERAADADLYAVVKADAYGHGTTGSSVLSRVLSTRESGCAKAA